MESMADNKGNITDEFYNCLLELADSSVGLIITGTAYISPEIESTNKAVGGHRNIDLMEQLLNSEEDINCPINNGGNKEVVPNKIQRIDKQATG